MVKQCLLIPFIFLLVACVLGALREHFDPFLILYAQDVLHPHPKPLEARLEGGFALELHAGSTPHTGRIAGLQKGLILTRDGAELVGDGHGLGVPIIHVAGRPYHASRAAIGKFVRGDTVVFSKNFSMDMAEFNEEAPGLQYRRVKSIGHVRVDYVILRNSIEVQADFSGLRGAPVERIFMLNELAGRQFRYALTTDGTRSDLLTWQAITADAVGLVAPALSAAVWIDADPVWPKFAGREILSRWRWYGHEMANWTACSILVDRPLQKFRYRLILQLSPPGQS